jgi:ABC-type glycerol-3-phosphate transport system substrate-binding protein
METQTAGPLDSDQKAVVPITRERPACTGGRIIKEDEVKRNRKLIAAAVGLAAVFALSACSTTATTGSSSSGGTTNLTFMTFETPSLNAKFWDTSITNATKAVPGVSIKKIVAPGDRNAYAKQLQASGQFPDILSSIDPKQFTSAGLLQPFSNAWLDKNFIVPRGNSIAGKSYIPPTNSQIIPMVFYNKKIFAKYNLQVPKTWNELMTVVKTLRAANVTPMEMAGGDTTLGNIPLSGIITADVLGADPTWVQDKYAGKVKFTDSDFVSAVQKYRDLITAGAFDPGALGVAYADANTQFLAGDAAMYPMGSWLIGSITPAQAADFGTFLLPSSTGKQVIPFNTGGTTSVSTKAPNVKKAIDFAESWSLSKANLTSLIETDGAFPMLKNVPFSAYKATVTPVYTAAYKSVTEKNDKVNAFAQVNNDDAFPAGMNDAYNAMTQKLFTDPDVKGQLAAFETAWDAAAK